MRGIEQLKARREQLLDLIAEYQKKRYLTRRFNYEIVDKKIDGKKYRVFQKRSD